MSKAEKRKGKKKVWIVILIIVVVIAAGLGGGILFTAPGRRELAELKINDVSFKNLHDGTYIGEYTGTKDHFRDTKVQVTISGGEITDIKILKGSVDKEGKVVELKNGMSIDNLFDNAVKEQSLQVDVISGATLTSKAHLKALENALEKASKELQ